MNRLTAIIHITVFTVLLAPRPAWAVQCPIPNCPAGQLCFCPPPPPHLITMEDESKSGARQVSAMFSNRIRNDLALTSMFRFKNRYSPRKEPDNKPLDQISPWHVIRIQASGSTTSAKIRITLLKRWPARGTGLKEVGTFSVKVNSTKSADTAADRAANSIMSMILGHDFSAFGTQVAFVLSSRPGHSVIRMMPFDGAHAGATAAGRLLSFDRSYNKEPVWSPDGRYLIFTSHIRYNPDLYIVNVDRGTPPLRISARHGMNHAAAFSPDMKHLALTLDFEGNPDIYLLRTDFATTRKWRIEKRLTRHHAIDTSPAFIGDGSRIVFVSSRAGKAQIYIMKNDGSGKRLFLPTSHRTYTPKWCRSGRRQYVAFTQLVGGKSVIFVYNLVTHKGWRATSPQAPNAENPSWSPDCNLLVYESEGSRGKPAGIWVSPIQGGASAVLYKGRLSMPAWRPTHSGGRK